MTDSNSKDRKAGALWTGDLKTGSGLISTESTALFELPYSHGTRFEDKTGLNPEELIAAAHAACINMAVVNTLKRNGYAPVKTETTATCTLTSNNGGQEITNMLLHVRGEVPDIDEATFNKMVMEADKSSPVSNLLRDGLEIEITTTLI
jgi:osmotically inducible protein OsmC